MQLGANQQLDRYTVLDMLGQGGMAVVYRLRHNQLETEHALKVLTLTKPSVRKRLILEGKVQASLRHANVVAVSDVLNIQGAPGLLMEYIAGPSLEDWLERYRPSLDEVEAVFRGIVKGVAHAHKQGLVHRDLKPGNVMLERQGDHLIPKVADFGLAKVFEDADEEGGSRRTRTGVAMGTPAYMAPEQIRSAKDVDVRADVYSLGCILYEMVTGTHAFDADDLPSIFEMVLSGSFEPVSSIVPDVPARFLMAIHGAMHVDKDKRIPDCETLLEVLSGEEWDLGKPADMTWGGSVDMQLAMPKGGTLVPAGKVSFPPPDFHFSSEALQASYPPKPKDLPTIEEIAKDTMGVSLLSASVMPDGTIDYASLIEAARSSQPQTVVIHQGGGWFVRGAAATMVAMMALILFFVARLTPVGQDLIAAVTPEVIGRALLTEAGEKRVYKDDDGIVAVDLDKALTPAPPPEPEEEKEPSTNPVVTVDAVRADGKREEVTAKIDMGPKYFVDNEEDLPEGVEAENTKTGGQEVLTAKVDVDGEGEADIKVQMTTEEIASLPEDKLPAGYGAIVVEGDAEKVWLASDQGRVEPGLVLAGMYQVKATFEGKEVGAGEVHVQAGKKITLRCDAMFRKCVK